MRPVRRSIVFAAVALFALTACQTSYDVENRETPVHVWLTVPGLAAQGGTIQALIYVGPHKVIEGPVRFPKGVPTITFPTAYLRAGDTLVSVVLDRGRLAGREEVEIEGESWVQITVGDGVSIRLDDKQPSPWGR